MNRSLYLVSSTMLWGLPPEKWFQITEEEGLAGIEVWAQQLESQEISAETVRRLALQHGAALTVHSYSWDMNLISLSCSMREAAEALTKKGIALASYLHAPHVTIHPGRDGLALPGTDFEELMAYSMRSLARYAAEEGTRASFEIMEKIPKERLTTPEAARRAEALAAAGPLWSYTEDTAHCDSEEEIFHIAECLGGSLAEFHVSNKKGTVRHIGDVENGDLNLPAVTARLEGYGLPMILEGFDPSMKAERLHRTLRWLDGAEERNGNK